MSAEDLGKRWNASVANGPITQQAREVLGLVFKKNNLYFERWRNVQLYAFPGWAQSPETETKREAELARLDKNIADVEIQIDSARKPKSHHFEIKPVAR